MIKCIIVEDETLAQDVIRNHLEHFDQFELVGTYRNAREEDLDYPWAVARAILRGSSHSLGA